MSATADQDLFVGYMEQQGGAGRGGGAAAGDRPPSVGMLTIPGFTYPVRELYLEDILERTGHVIGRSSRCGQGEQKPVLGYHNPAARLNRSKEAVCQAGQLRCLPLMHRYARKGTSVDDTWDAPGAEKFSEQTRRSMAVVDENQVRILCVSSRSRMLNFFRNALTVVFLPHRQINYEAIHDLLCLVAAEQQQLGPGAFISDWPEAAKYLNSGKGQKQNQGGAVLVFLPGAPEISRLQRLLTASERLAAAVGGRGRLRILPLHGSLSSADQTRVFARCIYPGCMCSISCC